MRMFSCIFPTFFPCDFFLVFFCPFRSTMLCRKPSSSSKISSENIPTGDVAKWMVLCGQTMFFNAFYCIRFMILCSNRNFSKLLRIWFCVKATLMGHNNIFNSFMIFLRYSILYLFCLRNIFWLYDCTYDSSRTDMRASLLHSARIWRILMSLRWENDKNT